MYVNLAEFGNHSQVKRINFFIILILIFSTFAGLYCQTIYAKPAKKQIHLAIIGRSDNPSLTHNKEKELFEVAGAKVSYIWSYNTKPSKYDGLIVPGGGDIDPSLYGKKSHPLTSNVNKSLDKREIYLIKKFAKSKKPIIGICKGCQAINVAFGGTLKQHIGYGHYGAWLNVKISKKSVFQKTYGKTEEVIHYHHQAVGKLAPNFIKTMWTGKVIEGIQHKTKPIYGVQWHPDLMRDYGGIACAKKFISICRKYAK